MPCIGNRDSLGARRRHDRTCRTTEHDLADTVEFHVSNAITVSVSVSDRAHAASVCAGDDAAPEVQQLPTPAEESPAPTTTSPVEKEPAEDWEPTVNPKATVTPGQMRSDREEIPEGFSKEDADKAETMEARALRSRAATGCQVYWPAPYEVCGAIRDKYNSLGGPNSFLLWPTTNELTNPDGYGKRTAFQNGPIHWSPAGGAHPVVNHFFAAWQRNGWEAGVLGYPTTDEIVNPDPVLPIGRRQEFTGGSVYWRLNEAWYVTGAIRDRWGQMGWEQSPALGYPLSDEIKLPDGQGRMNRFERGFIYWSPTTGAHPIVGAIRDQWVQSGYETGPYGYPTADEVSRAGIAVDQQFQGGTLYSPPKASADVLHNDYMADTGQAQCGLPVQQRTGAWACQGAPSVPSAPPSAQQRSPVETYCDPGFGGCWRQYDDLKADYEVDVIYGQGPQIIGTGTGYVLWQLEGPYTRITNAWLESDDAVLSNVWFSGALMNGAVGKEGGGSLIHKAQPQQNPGPHALGKTVKPLQPNGLTLEDRKMDDHNYVFQISAEFSEWPGYWYFWVRSPVAHYDDDDPNDVYRFQGADQLPGNPVDADWNW